MIEHTDDSETLDALFMQDREAQGLTADQEAAESAAPHDPAPAESRLMIEVCHGGPEDPWSFICGVWGVVQLDSLQEIEADLASNVPDEFERGAGYYRCWPEYEEGDENNAGGWWAGPRVEFVRPFDPEPEPTPAKPDEDADSPF